MSLVTTLPGIGSSTVAPMPSPVAPSPSQARPVRSIPKVLEPLDRLARDSRRLVGTSHPQVLIGYPDYPNPRPPHVGA